jgi:hypothetical protein
VSDSASPVGALTLPAVTLICAAVAESVSSAAVTGIPVRT